MCNPSEIGSIFHWFLCLPTCISRCEKGKHLMMNYSCMWKANRPSQFTLSVPVGGVSGEQRAPPRSEVFQACRPPLRAALWALRTLLWPQMLGQLAQKCRLASLQSSVHTIINPLHPLILETERQRGQDRLWIQNPERGALAHHRSCPCGCWRHRPRVWHRDRASLLCVKQPRPVDSEQHPHRPWPPGHENLACVKLILRLLK